MNTRLGQVTILLSILFLGGISPQDLKHSIAGMDTFEHHIIEKEDLAHTTCLEEQFTNHTYPQMDRGLCLYHNQLSETENQQAVELLQHSQTREGLPPVRQTSASFFEGLLHCRQANLHWDNFIKSNKEETLTKNKFCYERRMASASFSDTNLQFLSFSYEPNTNPNQTIPTRLDEMAACYVGPLAPEYDVECGLTSTLADGEVAAITNQAVDEVIQKYFQDDTSPVTAMFSRKKQRVKSVEEGAEAKTKALKEKSKALEANYNQVLTAFTNSEPQRKPIVPTYRQAILDAQLILDEHQRWVEGLFGSEALSKIQARNKQLEAENTRIIDEQFIETIKALPKDIERILQTESIQKDSLRQLCGIYYCEFLNTQNIKAVKTSCRKESMQNNPLCIASDNTMRSGKISVSLDGKRHQVSVENLCKYAGLDDQYRKIGLGEESKMCLASTLK